MCPRSNIVKVSCIKSDFKIYFIVIVYLPISLYFKDNLVLIFHIVPVFYVCLYLIKLIMFQGPLLRVMHVFHLNDSSLSTLFHSISIQTKIYLWRDQIIIWSEFVNNRKYVPLKIGWFVYFFNYDFLVGWNVTLLYSWEHFSFIVNIMISDCHIFHCDSSIHHTQQKNALLYYFSFFSFFPNSKPFHMSPQYTTISSCSRKTVFYFTSNLWYLLTCYI